MNEAPGLRRLISRQNLNNKIAQHEKKGELGSRVRRAAGRQNLEDSSVAPAALCILQPTLLWI